MRTLDDVIKSDGTWVVFDFPLPYEPMILNVDIPFDEQLPKGPLLDLGMKMLVEYRKKLA